MSGTPAPDGANPVLLFDEVDRALEAALKQRARPWRRRRVWLSAPVVVVFGRSWQTRTVDTQGRYGFTIRQARQMYAALLFTLAAAANQRGVERQAGMLSRYFQSPNHH